MAISFETPQNIEQRVHTDGADPNREAKEAYLIELYRQQRISHDDLSGAAGLGFHQAEQLIKDHGAGDDVTLAEFEAERKVLREMERR